MEQSVNLKREIGFIGLSSVIINTVIGAGIFVLPGIVAEKLGSASILAYLFCGILVILIMLCFAEVGSKITDTGGAYKYIEKTFGKYPGFLAAVLIPFASITADAAIANAIVNIAFKLYPPIDSEIVRILFFGVLFSGLAFINVKGVKKGVAFVKLITIIKIVPLLLIVFIGFKDADYSNLYWDAFPTIKDIGATSLILFFAFTGAGSALSVSGEVKNPQRTIPRAILFSVLIVGVIYVMVQTVAQGVLGSELPLYKENPLGEVASYIFGPIGFMLLTIGAAVSMFGGISSKVLSVPRVLFAASKDAVIPLKVLAKVHPKYATPYVSIISYTLLSLLLAILGGFQYLAVISSTSALLIALGIALSVIKLRREEKQVANSKTFRIPGGYTVPVLAIIVIFWFLSNLSTEKQIGLSVLIGILSLLFFIINGKVFWKGKSNN
jgi:amino acid transporter